MKMPQKSVCCSRRGDELSADETSQLECLLCAFCDNLRAEALQIHKHRAANSKTNVVNRLYIAARSSDDMSIKFDSLLLPKIIRPTS